MELPTTAESQTRKIQLQLRGSLHAPLPVARINQAWATALSSSGDIHLIDFHDTVEAADVTLANEMFPRILPPLEGRYIFVVPYGTITLDDAMLKRVQELCDDVWFFCEHTYNDAVARGLDRHNAFLVPLSIDTTIFSRFGHSGRPLIQERFTFLYVGALTRDSRFELLIDAFEQEFAAGEPVVCAIREWSHTARAADATEQLMLQNRIAALQANRTPRYYFLKTPLDPTVAAKLYRSADALIHPQMYDDGALQLLEAAACGLPIVKPASSHESFGRYSCYRIIDAQANATDDMTALRRSLRYAYEQHDNAVRQATAISALVREEHAQRFMTNAIFERLQTITQRSEPAKRGARLSRYTTPAQFEARMYSQNGEDGILHEVFRRLGINSGYFVEFGVESGRECNTAMLARRYGWQGLLIEGNAEDAQQLTENYAGFPRVRTACQMLDRENITSIFIRYNVPHDLDLLVIDVDGNDFHLWQALAAYRAKVVVIEINPAYPPPQDWVMLYNANHVWQRDAYYGASLQSMTRLAHALGYALIALDETSTNAIYVRRELLATLDFIESTPLELYKPPPNVREVSDRPAHHGNEVTVLLADPGV